jgi:hypothetical protein
VMDGRIDVLTDCCFAESTAHNAHTIGNDPVS